jgi:hypothetical protein
VKPQIPETEKGELQNMNPQLAQLDDRAACRLLNRLVKGLGDATQPELELTPELRHALAVHCALPATDLQPLSTSDATTAGDLARATLQWLTADPELEPRILAMASEREIQRFGLDPISSVAVITLALSALQTQVNISWDKQRGFRIALKKKSASDALLKQFLAKLVGFVPGKPGKSDS